MTKTNIFSNHTAYSRNRYREQATQMATDARTIATCISYASRGIDPELEDAANTVRVATDNYLRKLRDRLDPIDRGEA